MNKVYWAAALFYTKKQIAGPEEPACVLSVFTQTLSEEYSYRYEYSVQGPA